VVPFLRHVSAQIYNRVEQYEQLTEALSGPAPGRTAPPKTPGGRKEAGVVPDEHSRRFPTAHLTTTPGGRKGTKRARADGLVPRVNG